MARRPFVTQTDHDHMNTLTLDELEGWAEEWADDLRDMMELAGEGAGDPEYWADVHPDEPMPGPPASRTAWKRHDRMVDEAEAMIGAIDRAIDERERKG